MSRPPTDPAQGVLGGGLWWRILALSLVVAGAGGAGAAVVPDASRRPTLMLALSTAMLGVAWASRVRAARDPNGNNSRPRNPALLAAIAGSLLLLVGAVTLPVLQRLLETTYPGPLGLAAAGAAGCAGYVARRSLDRRKGSRT